jgi:hypothetical protein
MKRHLLAICLTILILVQTMLVVSCRSSSTAETHEIGQKYLFEVSYINHAWGYVDQGMYVDRDGNVYSYDLSDRNPRFQYPEGGIYSQALLDDKYSSNPVYMRTVDVETLVEMSDLIGAASQGQLTDRVYIGCDGGGESFTAFLFDAEAGVYTSVLTRACGDWSRENTAPEAATLFDWLQQLRGGSMC